MIVVADTSPLNYLIQIECDRLLHTLFHRIVIPQGVMDELRDAGAPSQIRRWLEKIPEWIETRAISSPPDPTLDYLGSGEREAIQISQEMGAELLLIDDRKGRVEAMPRGLRITGTLGVLLSGAEAKLINPETAYRRLIVETTFRVSPVLEEQFLARLQKIDK